jgi:hypothetical protein
VTGLVATCWADALPTRAKDSSVAAIAIVLMFVPPSHFHSIVNRIWGSNAHLWVIVHFHDFLQRNIKHIGSRERRSWKNPTTSVPDRLQEEPQQVGPTIGALL